MPSNPSLSLSAAHRSAGDLRATNWYATLSQEVEIAGQRSMRRAEADSAIQAQRSELAANEREVAALAWRRYFEAL
ncbi:MAG TPA: hypothetical protein VMF89_30820, partial [Polyangiales bacterium]|nr:hypothetical protein [Polyangiales bacterium]